MHRWRTPGRRRALLLAAPVAIILLALATCRAGSPTPSPGDVVDGGPDRQTPIEGRTPSPSATSQPSQPGVTPSPSATSQPSPPTGRWPRIDVAGARLETGEKGAPDPFLEGLRLWAGDGRQSAGEVLTATLAASGQARWQMAIEGMESLTLAV
ncbi:MAG: hypothetical protein PVJ34_16620, partial [Anaerolineae bacterium]